MNHPGIPGSLLLKYQILRAHSLFQSVSIIAKCCVKFSINFSIEKTSRSGLEHSEQCLFHADGRIAVFNSTNKKGFKTPPTGRHAMVETETEVDMIAP